MKNLAVTNWLRRARLSSQRKTRVLVINAETPDLIDVTEIMVTVDGAETAVSDVGASELGVSAENAGTAVEISGTSVSFVRIED